MNSADASAKDETRDGRNSVVSSRTRFGNLTLSVLLVVSVVLNVLLARKINRLTGAQNPSIAERQLKVGTKVPGFRAVDLKGQTQFVSYDLKVGKLTVLYVFTPPCHWCDRNLDNLKELVSRKGDEYRFIGISLASDGLPDYVARNGLTMHVYTDLSEETKKAYKMGGTPQTIVVSPEGKVLQSWMGAYTGEQKNQVDSFFRVTLPGIRPAS